MGSGVLAQMAAQQGKRRSPEREIWRRYSRELLLPDRLIDREQAPTSLRNDLGAAERLLLEMLDEDQECIPVLSNLGHLYGRHLSEFETAIEYYNRVLELEPDNAWARDARRRYLRYVE